MRGAAILALGLLAGGCEHMYGAVDAALSDADAVRIARREATRNHVFVEGSTARAEDHGAQWLVVFEPPPPPAGYTLLGGGVAVEVEKSTRRPRVAYVEQ